MELNVIVKNESTYTANVIVTIKGGADGNDSTFSTQVDFGFSQSMDDVTDVILNDIVNATVDIREETKGLLKEQLLTDLEREMKRVKGE